MYRTIIGVASVAAVASGPAVAAPDAYHDAPAPDIVVTAPLPASRFDAVTGVSVLQGADLAGALRPSLGETLARTPGVSATSFGPAASRPILRGLQGDRVQVLTDGLGAIDVSSVSADHAVVVNPLLAERIEILRGPEALLYDAAALGGVVNVLDRRIPRKIPDEPAHIEGNLGFGSAATERRGAIAVDVPLGRQLVVHADGSYLKAGDQRIGGFALAPAARAAALRSSLLPPDQQIDADGAPIDFAATAAIRGTLPNSAVRTWEAGVGAAFITDRGSLGLSYSHHDSFYGVPVRYATAPGAEQEAPRIALRQDRFDARAQVSTGGAIETVKARLAAASYRHFELEADGSIGTAFYNKGLEGRIDLVQRHVGAWSGASGAQLVVRDFDVDGAEAFLPRNSTTEASAFTLQQLDYGALKLQAAARFERAVREALPQGADSGFFAGRRRFDTFSASLGGSYGLTPDWRIGATLSRTGRAPGPEELFANGPHAGTQSFEIGNPDFRTERATSIDASLHGRGEGWHLELSLYYSWFANFIYERQSGELVDGLPVYHFAQGRAHYYGFEAQGAVDLARLGPATLTLDGLADHVRATIDDVGAAPRIPPLRLLGGLELHGERAKLRGEVEWVNSQHRIAAFETPTPGYTLVNLEAELRPWGSARPLSFTLAADNIFDVTARRHSSFLKDFAPLPGRDLRISANFNF